MTKFNRVNSQTAFRTKSRRQTGSQIAELPPALILIFFVFLFPMMDLLYIFGAYGAGWYLNYFQLREVACSLPSSIGLTNPPDAQWHGNVYLPQTAQGWHGILGVEQIPPSPEVMQINTAGNPNGVTVSFVRTTVSIRPFVAPLFQSLPWLGQIPGLGQPLNFVYSNSVMQEEFGI